MKIQLNKPLRGYHIGKVIDFGKTKLDKYWLNRIKDSEVDHCISVINDSLKKEKTFTKSNRKLRLKNGD